MRKIKGFLFFGFFVKLLIEDKPKQVLVRLGKGF